MYAVGYRCMGVPDATSVGAPMNIGWAVTELRNGRTVRRKAWAANVSLVLIRPRAETPTGHAPDPFFEVSREGRRLPAVLAAADLLATDWVRT